MAAPHRQGRGKAWRSDRAGSAAHAEHPALAQAQAAQQQQQRLRLAGFSNTPLAAVGRVPCISVAGMPAVSWCPAQKHMRSINARQLLFLHPQQSGHYQSQQT